MKKRCPWCGVRLSNHAHATCLSCRSIDLHRGYAEADELTGGRWVNVRGIQRWEADPTPPPASTRTIITKRKPNGRCLDCGTDVYGIAHRCAECRAEARRRSWRLSKLRARDGSWAVREDGAA